MMADGREEPAWHRDGLRNFLLYQLLRMQSAKPPKFIPLESFDPFTKKEKPLPGTIEDFKALLRIPTKKKKK
jgi:hypothetical protein